MKGTLWLIPNVLDDGNPTSVLSQCVLEQVRKIRYFIIENEKSARRFLVRAGLKEVLDEIEWGMLNEHTREPELAPLLNPILQGADGGVLSESGCPGVADPGADIVRLAHQSGILVKPLTGPSSVILALMASGLNGQSFAFLGYLPVKPPERIKKIREIEQRSRLHKETQIFIEAPYRNRQLLSDLIQTLSPESWLSVSADLTSTSEYIRTAQVWEWSRKVPDLNKRPAIFLVSAK
ncbi:MAG: SAM-dependent methyltransferase [Bacteroidetes bacterium GWF2_49_14]|nr:MAG: SAM-dependent methyltransferase [Bacteroidetes bacterium GWF2_49_14]HBB91480.1 SAM-dependent methyltransferase [Bacteroidales bacterium]